MLKTRILITGATGFVGRQIIAALERPGISLIPVIRKGKEASINKIANVEKIISTSDLFTESEDWWTDHCREVDLIIHAAWYAEPGKYLQSEKNMDCLIGSLNLARGAAKAGIKRFVGIGTCFEYDLKQGVLSVETPLKPDSPYAAAKSSLYLGLSQWLPAQSISFAWCRLFYLYGEGEDERRLVPYLHNQLRKGEAAELTSGRQIRDFLDVAEAGEKIVEVALGSQSGPVNVCSGTPITVRQLAEKIAADYGRNDLLQFGVRAENFTDPPCVLGIPNYKKIFD